MPRHGCWETCGGGKRFLVAGRRRISKFIESLLRPYVFGKDLEAAYREMTQDEGREAEALDWAETTVREVPDMNRPSKP